MKKLLIFCCLAALILIDADGKIVKKRKRVTTEKPATATEETKLPEELPPAGLVEEEGNANELADTANDYPPQDPCMDKRCGPGRECTSTSQGKAKCVCLTSCPTEDDDRRRVCSNYNETWTSDCDLYRARCVCDSGSAECIDQANKHLHIEYYGECRQIEPCTEEEMSDFPRRMRDWLFNVMRELADRRELSPHYLKMEREAERATSDSQRSVAAAVWKWCDLDGHPNDRQVSRHELFPIRAPLMALEHCIAPFLNNCDADNDHRITLQEWGNCLQVPQQDMLDKCDDVRDGVEENEEGEEEV